MSNETPAASAATAEQTGSQDIGTLSGAAYDAWRSTGALPTADGTQQQQATTEQTPAGGEQAQDAQAGQQAAEQTPQGQQPAAQQAQPPKISNRQRILNDAIRTATEARLENERLRAELSAARGGHPQQGGQQQQAQAHEPQPTRPRPELEQFDSYQAYEDAVYKWRREQETAQENASRQQRQQTDAEVARAQKVAGWIERRDAHEAAKPGFIAKTQEFLNGVYPGTPLFDVLTDSLVGPQLAEYLAEHPDEADRIADMHPISALRAYGALEAKLTPADAASAAATAQPASAGGTQPKTVSTAPAPPVTLTAKPGEAVDAEAAAVNRGDFSAYAREANKRELAGQGARR